MNTHQTPSFPLTYSVDFSRGRALGAGFPFGLPLEVMDAGGDWLAQVVFLKTWAGRDDIGQ